MTKSKIITLADQGSKTWQGKELKKLFLVFENGESGTLTVFPDQTAPAQGDEIEYTIEDKGFGKEIKQVSAGGGARGGFPRANPRDKALASAVGLVKSGLEGQALKWEDVRPELIELHQICLNLIEGNEPDQPF